MSIIKWSLIMNKDNFSLVLDENVIRKMTREEYYKTASSLRKIKRVIASKLPDEKYFEEKMSDLIIYGYCEW